MPSERREGIVYLVGAGPGDPALITRRGAEVLGRADVVAYDRLAHPALLELAPGAELVDVGKRAGKGGAGQDIINRLLVDHAKAGKVVVRLKGGDPFVFGRGGEEAEALADAGVRFEVVPGVTSAVAAPAFAGIPLTHRHLASWVAIATGHEHPHHEGSAVDWDAMARAPTAVFLMGIGRIARITEELIRRGRPDSTPAAVIASATWPSQRAVRATLGTIATEVEREGIEPPAVLVVGDVAALADKLGWFGARPLAGKRVFVTRARVQAGTLAAKLRELGAEALEFPAIVIRPPATYEALDGALERLGDVDWVLFTSANAVDAVWDRLLASGGDARAFGGVRVAAVGPATAERLRSVGVVPDLVPETFEAGALAAALGRGTGRVLVPQAEGAPDAIAKALEGAGWRCEAVAAYRTEVDRASADRGREALGAGVDAVLFTSGSTVRSFCGLWGRPPADALVCCIGPRTAEAAAEAGVRVDAVADEATVDGLVAALLVAVGR